MSEESTIQAILDELDGVREMLSATPNQMTRSFLIGLELELLADLEFAINREQVAR